MFYIYLEPLSNIMHGIKQTTKYSTWFLYVDCTSHMIDFASEVLHEAQHAWAKINCDTNFAYLYSWKKQILDNRRIFQNSAHYAKNKRNWLQLVFKLSIILSHKGGKIKTVSNIETSQSIRDEVIIFKGKFPSQCIF